MIVNFHGMQCRYGTYRTQGIDKPILTLINSADVENPCNMILQNRNLVYGATF